MRILAIETSCDETAIAIVEVEGAHPETRFRVLADKTLTQVELHKEYGGVFPMMAKREHARSLVPLLKVVLKEAGLYRETSRHVVESPLRTVFAEIMEREPELFAQFITEVPTIDPPPIDLIAVTSGPGLEPALWVGINFAKALSMVWKKPVLPVNHMEGHLVTPLLSAQGSDLLLSAPELPLLALLVSGGHTELVLMREWGVYELLGQTLDDAVGEAFDKVARILGLPYPGGPEISHLAQSGKPGAVALPRPMLHSPNFDFSFSGLKTAVLYKAKELGVMSQEQKADMAHEFQEACVDVLTTKTRRAAREHGVRTVVVGGGVSANTRLREHLTQSLEEDGVPVLFPKPALSTDNALMIAIVAGLRKDAVCPPLERIIANGNWRISAN